MPFYPADYLKDTRHLTPAQHGAYLLLILEYWIKGKLPPEDRQLARIVGMRVAEWREAKPTIQAFFHDGWNHKRLDKERANAEVKHSARQAAGKRGGISKAKAKQTASNALASSSQPQSDSDADASETRARADDWPNDYRELFWQLYPHKIGKKTALAKLDRIRKRRDATWPHLVAALRRYIADKPPDQAWCNPETWLNQGRWDDQPAFQLTGSYHGKDQRAGSLVGAIQRELDSLEREDEADPTVYPGHIQRLPR